MLPLANTAPSVFNVLSCFTRTILEMPMRWTQYFIPTLKEDPSDAEVISHRLMVRAGLIRKAASGAYTYLPLGLSALRKAEQIVREEMNRAGAIEIEMPALQPEELWRETGRLETFGPDLVKYTDRHGRVCIFGPTHEEIVTDLVRNHVNSYKQLPLNLYQIQTKFRDEVRPRFGVLRSKEFLMKDAYSFHRDEASLEETYRAMYAAYSRIAERAGLPYVVVEAASGAIGGEVNHEFMVPSEIGEAVIASCTCGYAANTERASVGAPAKEAASAPGPVTLVDTPNAGTIKEVSAYLSLPPSRLVKTLIFVADGEPVAALVRGDHDLNEDKLRAALGTADVSLADPATIERATGAPVGFAGPVGLKIRVVVDHAVAALAYAATGANKADAHLTNVVPGRDFPLAEVVDIHLAAEGDVCPRCGAGLKFQHGIEIGHIFKLGRKYTDAMHAVYLDENGKPQTMIMGCYGIGVNRIIAAMIETSHDDKGIIWTKGLAPFDVEIVAVDVRDGEVAAAADRLYAALVDEGVDVLYDDRDLSPGIKFNDADLVGLPIRVTIGKRSLKKGGVEVKKRGAEGVDTVALADAANWIAKEVAG
jgi:prolyl-tRNA synthetase